MPTITTAGSGDWDSTTPNAPWPGGTIPAAIDNIVVADGHTLTVPSGYVAECGDPATPSVEAIRTAGTGGTGILVVNGTLRFAANVRQGNATWRVNGGGILESNHSSTALDYRLSDANSQANAILELIGSSGNRAIFRTRPGTARMAGIFSGETTRNASTNSPSSGVTGGGRVRAEWAHIDQVGSSTSAWCITNLSSNNLLFSDTRITQCGPWHVYNVSTTGDWTVDRVSYLDPEATIGIRWVVTTNATGTRTRLWRDMIVEGQCLLPMLNSTVSNQWLFDRVAFGGRTNAAPILSGGGNSLNGTWTDVLVYNRMTTGTDRSAFPMGSHERLISLRAQAATDDDHFSVPTTNLSTTIDGGVVEYAGTSSAGDVFVCDGSSAGTPTVTIRNVVSLANASNGNAAGVFCIPVGLNTSNNTFRIEKNTILGDGLTAFSTEILTASTAGDVEYVRNNLLVRTTSGTSAVATDSATNPANLADGIYNGCDYNVTHNITGGKYPQLAAKYASPAPPGPNDQSLNPSFADSTRRWLTWGQSINGSIASWADIWTEIRKRNDDSGYNSAFDWRNAYTWIREGYRPTNTSIMTAAHDGGRVGALDVQTSVRRRATLRAPASTQYKFKNISKLLFGSKRVSDPLPGFSSSNDSTFWWFRRRKR